MNVPNLPQLTLPLVPGQNSTGPTEPGKLAGVLGIHKLYANEPDPTYTLANQGYAAGADAGVTRGLIAGAVVAFGAMYLMGKL